MKFYGNANLQQNELQQAVIPIDERFPLEPKVGQLAFVNRILYICVDISDNLPVWVPMTRELTMYTHNQSSSAATWTVTHNLNTTSVNVQVFDVDNRVVIPDQITVTNSDTVTIELSSGMTGRAIVLTGHNDGNVKPTYSYIHYQTESSDAWSITHGLGREPIVRVFIGNQEVQPASIVHASNNQLTINFNQPYSGIVKLI